MEQKNSQNTKIGAVSYLIQRKFVGTLSPRELILKQIISEHKNSHSTF